MCSLPDFPKSQAWPFLSRLPPGASFLFSPRPPPPQPASSLPDAPLSLQGPADCLPAAAGPKDCLVQHRHRGVQTVWQGQRGWKWTEAEAEAVLRSCTWVKVTQSQFRYTLLEVKVLLKDKFTQKRKRTLYLLTCLLMESPVMFFLSTKYFWCLRVPQCCSKNSWSRWGLVFKTRQKNRKTRKTKA